METIRKIRLAARDKKSIRQIARDLRLSRNTVRKVLRSGETRCLLAATCLQTFNEHVPARRVARPAHQSLAAQLQIRTTGTCRGCRRRPTAQRS